MTFNYVDYRKINSKTTLTSKMAPGGGFHPLFLMYRLASRQTFFGEASRTERTGAIVSLGGQLIFSFGSIARYAAVN